MLNMTTTKEETDLISRIVGRIVVVIPKYHAQRAYSDLVVCHCNGCPLYLKGLLIAQVPDFIDDINGIRFNLDANTGNLLNDFKPKFSAVNHVQP